MTDELILFLKLMKNKIFFLSIKSKELYLMLAKLVDIFEELNVLNLILQSKNITLHQ